MPWIDPRWLDYKTEGIERDRARDIELYKGSAWAWLVILAWTGLVAGLLSLLATLVALYG